MSRLSFFKGALFVTSLGLSMFKQLEENIPLRIMLLLMDEVFDLRHKNQWLRRQIVRFLKQFIKTAMGDRINKYVFNLFSPIGQRPVALFILSWRYFLHQCVHVSINISFKHLL